MFGLFSYSKMFMVIAVILGLILLLKQVVTKGIRLSALAIMGICGIAWSVLYNQIVKYVLGPYGHRLADGLSSGNITTGRTEIVSHYLAIIENGSMYNLLFGTGFAPDSNLLQVATHNTYITSLYSLGIVGAGALIFYYSRIAVQLRGSMTGYVATKRYLLERSLPIFVMLLSMSSLDFLYMDFFPYLIYLTILIYYSSNAKGQLKMSLGTEAGFYGQRLYLLHSYARIRRFAKGL